MKRVFFAINLPPELKTRLADFVYKLEKINPRRKISWVMERNFHITLEFLGDQNDEQIEKAKTIARSVAEKTARFELWTSDLGCFPNERAPSVIWLGTDSSESVQKLQNELRRNLLTVGFQTDSRAWHSHITLGRVKDRNGKCDFGNLEPPAVKFSVNSFELMESKLTPRGSEYSILESFQLKA